MRRVYNLTLQYDEETLAPMMNRDGELPPFPLPGTLLEFKELSKTELVKLGVFYEIILPNEQELALALEQDNTKDAILDISKNKDIEEMSKLFDEDQVNEIYDELARYFGIKHKRKAMGGRGNSCTGARDVKISVFTPLIYVGVVLTVFVIFSIIYRRRRLQSFTQIEPLFKENYPAEIYHQLKAAGAGQGHTQGEEAAREGDEGGAFETCGRSHQALKENEAAFAKLYQNGLIGDDIFKQYEFQIKFQELELKEIVAECEGYKKGWVQSFFPTAQEICFNEALRRRLNAMEK
ncbi:Translocation protein SEC66 [Candida viswanathii]|uniref:Translocation protein SEC66 n=1 Tax=Candida viswanathii TaxID=5486 RepID=A0A367XT93_9ASCO|nr:Translocation protein SEC66 [Candida viswanathii]